MTRRRLSNKAGVEGAVSTKDFSTMARQQAKDVLERSGEYDPKVVNVAFAGHQMDDPATSLLSRKLRFLEQAPLARPTVSAGEWSAARGSLHLRRVNA